MERMSMMTKRSKQRKTSYQIDYCSDKHYFEATLNAIEIENIASFHPPDQFIFLVNQ
jgi:hypothetical protein